MATVLRGEIVNESGAGALGPVLSVAEVNNPALLYLASKQGSSRQTMATVLRRLALALGYDDFREVPWHGLRFNTVLALHEKLMQHQPPYSASSMQISGVGLMGVIKYCMKLHPKLREEYDAIEWPRHQAETMPRPHQRELSRDDFKKLVNACIEKPSVKGWRDLAILYLICGVGCRREDIITLNVEDFDRDKLTLTVNGKGDRVDVLPVEAQTVAPVLRQWLAVRSAITGTHTGPLILPATRAGHLIMRRPRRSLAYDVIIDLAKRAGLPHTTPHTGRYTYGTWLLRAGIDDLLAAKLMRHRNVETMKRYDFRTAEDLRQAREGLSLPESHTPAERKEKRRRHRPRHLRQHHQR